MTDRTMDETHRQEHGQTSTILDRPDIAKPFVIGAYAIMLAVAAVPLAIAEYPALTDYINHLARMYILVNYDESAILPTVYQIQWKFIPNLAMDLVVPGIAPLIGVEAAARTFVFLTLALISSGAVAMNYALTRSFSVSQLAIFAILYNSIVNWGLLNYLFGLGVALWLFAIYLFSREARPAWRIAITSAGALVLYFSHLYAFAIYGIAVIGIELYRFATAADRKITTLIADLITAGIQAVIPVVVFFALSPTGHSETLVEWASVRRKFDSLTYLASGYNDLLDFLTYAAMAALIGFLVGRREITIARPMRGILIFLSLLYVVMPAQIFASWMADRRLFIAIGFLAAASLSIRLRSNWMAAVTVAAIVGTFSLHTFATAKNWLRYDRQVAGYVEAFEKIEPGARVSFALSRNASYRPLSVRHLPTLMVVKREAFSPNIFANPGYQTVVLRPDYQRLASLPHGDELMPLIQDAIASGSRARMDMIFKDLLSDYQYLLVMVENEPFPDFGDYDLPLLHAGRDFRLYRLD